MKLNHLFNTSKYNLKSFILLWFMLCKFEIILATIKIKKEFPSNCWQCFPPAEDHPVQANPAVIYLSINLSGLGHTG